MTAHLNNLRDDLLQYMTIDGQEISIHLASPDYMFFIDPSGPNGHRAVVSRNNNVIEVLGELNNPPALPGGGWMSWTYRGAMGSQKEWECEYCHTIKHTLYSQVGPPYPCLCRHMKAFSKPPEKKVLVGRKKRSISL